MRRELLLLREMRDAAMTIKDLVGDRSTEQVEADTIRRAADSRAQVEHPPTLRPMARYAVDASTFGASRTHDMTELRMIVLAGLRSSAAAKMVETSMPSWGLTAAIANERSGAHDT